MNVFETRERLSVIVQRHTDAKKGYRKKYNEFVEQNFN